MKNLFILLLCIGLCGCASAPDEKISVKTEGNEELEYKLKNLKEQLLDQRKTTNDKIEEQNQIIVID